jgi:demethoxyubiquinone hydroxylase (CLK1/Coq7/Cat5 family)
MGIIEIRTSGNVAAPSLYEGQKPRRDDPKERRRVRERRRESDLKDNRNQSPRNIFRCTLELSVREETRAAMLTVFSYPS